MNESGSKSIFRGIGMCVMTELSGEKDGQGPAAEGERRRRGSKRGATLLVLAAGWSADRQRDRHKGGAYRSPSASLLSGSFSFPIPGSSPSSPLLLPPFSSCCFSSPCAIRSTDILWEYAYKAGDRVHVGHQTVVACPLNKTVVSCSSESTIISARFCSFLHMFFQYYHSIFDAQFRAQQVCVQFVSKRKE